MSGDLKLKPNDASVMAEIGLAYTEQNEIEKALRIYRQAIEISPNSAILHNRLGYELLRVREFKEAEFELDHAISLDPGLHLAYQNLSNLYYFTNRSREGIEIVKKCIRKAHPDLQGLDEDFYMLGNFYNRIAQFDEAAEALRQAIELNPDNANAYCSLGLTNTRQGKDELAVEVFNKGLRVNPNSPCLHANLGFLLIHMKQMDEAEVHLKKVLKLSPDNPQSYFALAELMAKKQDWEQAASLLNTALKLAPGDFRVYVMLANVFDNSGKIEDAERELRDALRFEPDNPEVLNDLGYFLVDHDKDLKEAADMIERAVAANPNNAAYLDSLGWAHFKLGHLDLAEKYLLESLKGRQNHPVVLEHLGDVCMNQNKEDMARQRWREAIALAETDAQTQRLLRKLGENKD